MEYDYEIRRLSQAFYERYPEEQYPELLQKTTRSYTCLDDGKATVDQDEYHKLTKHIHTICQEASVYIDDYLLHQSGQCILDNNEYELRYKYTSLKYFHAELGLK